MLNSSETSEKPVENAIGYVESRSTIMRVSAVCRESGSRSKEKKEADDVSNAPENVPRLSTETHGTVPDKFSVHNG